GRLTFNPYVVLAGQTRRPDRCSAVVNAHQGVVHLSYGYGADFAEDWFLRLGEDGLTADRTFRNAGNRTVDLTELGLELGGIAVGGETAGDYFYHVENPRIYGRMAIPVDLKRTPDLAASSEYDVLAGNRWADPGVVSERIGASPYQPFPAILVSNHASPRGLVHGTLSQRVFYHNYLVNHAADALQLDILSSFKAVACRKLAPGEVLRDAWYLGVTDQAADLQRCFARYTAVLRRKLPALYGATPINRHSLVWGSWNDGHGPKVTQAQILKTAAFLAEHFPSVEWVQLDDGYAALRKNSSAHGLGMPYEGEAGVDRDKFPDGLKAFTDRVKQTGLRPAIWIGGALPAVAPLSKDHPDWFVDYSLRTPDRRVFDVSRPEARAYMCEALDYFLRTSGFEAVKHDFWSYAFEDSHPLLADPSRSGYEWRDWWLKEVRTRLPNDAYFQTGCDIVMANPFLGEFFTNYRYGIDIGGGNWEHVTTTMLWGAACFALNIGDLIVPNSDAVGLFPGLEDSEAMVCLNYCLISRSMVEIAGWLYDTDTQHPRFKALQKAVCCPNNGGDVFFADYAYRRTDEAPAVWYFKGPFFSLLESHPHLPVRTVALFNIGDTPRTVGFDRAGLGLPGGAYVVCDVWKRDGVVPFGDGRFEVELPPHASRLFTVTPNDGTPRLLDAGVKV
ncbi:MAG: hypothetical protein GX595_18380, partial [Lentisphaerae bacterium]|nr:hypothetical protein [Lentisphaerota bacterium]